MPNRKAKSQRKILKLSQCIKNVSLTEILLMLRIAYGKIEIEFDEEVLYSIMIKDKEFLDRIKFPKKHHTCQDEEYYLVEMVGMGYSQVVKVMLLALAKPELECKLYVKYESNNLHPAGTDLFYIAYC